MKMKTNLLRTTCSVAIVLLSFSGCTDKKDIPVIKPAEKIVDKNWQFETNPIWEDNFSASGRPDASKWSLEVNGNGGGNDEKQYYTDGTNVNVENGNLNITAKRESFLGKEYTSSRLITQGKGDWLYGRFEVRAKLPKGKGTWPAIWMLYSKNIYGDWPASGEIDIMEHVGFDPNVIHASIHTSAYNHTRGTQKTAQKTVPGATDDFHIYRVDWTPYSVRGFVDDEQYFEFVNENKDFTAWPFNQKFFMILNVAVGGNWGGAQGIDNNAFPATMSVDYVKVFKMIEQ